MNILVISLPNAKERRDFQQNQLFKLGLDFKFLDATSTNDINTETYKKHYYDWQRPLRNTEVACYFSHRSAWQKIIDNNMPALILEDDALLSQCVPELLKSFANTKNVDLINLEVRSRKKIISKIGQGIACNSRLFKLYQDRTGAAGYILWPSGAKKLLQFELEHGIALADAQIASCNTLVSYQIEPAAIIQLDQCKHYGISNTFSDTVKMSTVSQPKNPKVYTTFWMKRISAQIKLSIRMFTFLIKSRRRYIKLNKENFYKK